MMDFIVALEKNMASVDDGKNPFSYAYNVDLDEQELFPDEAFNQLNQWGVHDYFIPQAVGGKLTSFPKLLLMMRLISRRDLTIAIGYGKTFLGASPVWVAGSDEQKKN